MAKGIKTGGRVKGSKNKRTVQRELLQRQAEEWVAAGKTPEQMAALTPLEVMGLAMQSMVVAGHLKDAAGIAADMAPFVHQRLTAMTVQEVNPLASLSIETLQEIIGRLRELAARGGNAGSAAGGAAGGAHVAAAAQSRAGLSAVSKAAAVPRVRKDQARKAPTRRESAREMRNITDRH